MLKRCKKGELTSAQLVGLILGIVGFVVVLLLLFSLNFEGKATQDICELSVLTRATVPEEAQPYVPLKCTTSKICIVDNGRDECSQFLGEKEVQKVVLKGSPEEKSERIAEISARAMYNCWNTMGEGKLDLFGSYTGSRGLTTEKAACVICSRVAIGESVSEEIINGADIYKYMRDNSPNNDGYSYLNTFSDRSVNSYAGYDKAKLEETLKENSEEKDATYNGGNGREIAAVFSQVKSTGILDAWSELGTDALIVSGSTFMTPGVGQLAGRLVMTPAGLIFAGVATVGGVTVSGVNAYTGQLNAAAYCGQFTTTETDEDLRAGCSAIQLIPYNFKDINNMCPQIEGLL